MKRFSCALSALLVLLVPNDASPEDAVRQVIEEKIDAVLRADEPAKAAEHYHDLFVASGAKGLSELKQSPHDSIAIQAAWQEVALTVPESVDEGNPVFRPDRGKLNWFLGFLEGRTRIRVPKWWLEAVLDARANQRDNIYFPYNNWGRPTAKWTTEAAVTKKGDKFLMQMGNESIDLPKELVKRP
jgi:hypothetical protein